MPKLEPSRASASSEPLELSCTPLFPVRPPLTLPQKANKEGEAGESASVCLEDRGCSDTPSEARFPPREGRLGLRACGLSEMRHRAGILQAWLPAGVQGYRRGRRQAGTRSSPWACTCAVGQKTITDVPGIPKPDTKSLAGCRGGGRSQVSSVRRLRRRWLASRRMASRRRVLGGSGLPRSRWL